MSALILMICLWYRMFVMALAGTRDENPNVNHAAVHQDVQALHNAGTGRLGTVSFLGGGIQSC